MIRNKWIKSKKLHTLTVLSASCMLALSVSLPVWAQDSQEERSSQSDDRYDSGRLEEIVVTSARRRAEDVQDVPIAVSILTDKFLEDNNIMDLGDISNVVPNAVISAGRATNSTVIAYVRGLGQNDPLWGFEPAVGIYMDDVFIARPQGALLDVYDVQSIEVLRGPQGTLYGKNTLAGAIKYNTRDIVGDTYARADVTIGSYSQLDVKGSASTGITDNFYIGGSFAYLTRDGYGNIKDGETPLPRPYNKVGDDVSNKDLLAARINATWLIGDNTKLKFAADTVKDDSHSVGSRRLNDNWGPALKGRYDTQTDLPVSADSVKMTGASLKLESTLSDSWGMKLIGAYRKGETLGYIDFEALNQPAFNVLGQYDDNQTSFEAQFNYQGERLAAVMGAFYYDGDACGAYDAVLGLFGITSLVDGCVNTESISVYADASYALTDKWNLSVGGRWNQDDKKASVFAATYLGVLTGYQTAFDPNNMPANLTLLSVDSDYTNSNTFDDFTPRISLDYTINDNMMTYASYTNGFKSGGFDMRGNQAAYPDTVDGYDSESVDSYEIGLKTTSLDGRLIFNVTAFYADYTDVQITTQQFVELNGIPTNATAVQNAGQQVNKGLELEAVWSVNDYFRLSGVVGFLNADITEFLTSDPANPGTIIDISNTVDPLFSPDMTAALSSEFFWDMAGGNGYARLGYSYVDDIKVMNLVPSVGDQSAYGVFNATVAYTTSDGNWRFALSGNNLTDEEYLQAGYDFGPTMNYIGQLGFYGAPRTFSLSATYTY